MDRRSQFHFRSRTPHHFVRGRPVAHDNTTRFLFGENRPSCDGEIRFKHVRSGFRLFRPTGYFGAPFRDLRMATVLRILAALVFALFLGSVVSPPARAQGDASAPPIEAYLVSFPAGAFTAHVTSRSGAAGEVLLEFYDVPDAAVAVL